MCYSTELVDWLWALLETWWLAGKWWWEAVVLGVKAIKHGQEHTHSWVSPCRVVISFSASAQSDHDGYGYTRCAEGWVSLLLWQRAATRKHAVVLKGAGRWQCVSPMDFRNIHLQLLRLPQTLLETVHLQGQGLPRDFLASVSFLMLMPT